MPVNAVKHDFDLSSTEHVMRLWIDHIAIPTLCRQFGADILFSMSNFGPYLTPCPHVVGIHLPYLAYPVWPIWERLSLRDRLFSRARSLYFSVAVAHVDRFCALTRTSAARMAETCCLAPERMTVVPNAGPPDSYFETPDVPRIRETITRHPATLRLCYPALGYPTKNHEVLPEAVQILHDRFGIDGQARSLSPSSDRFDQRETVSLNRQRPRFGSPDRINLGRLRQSDVPTVLRYCNGLLMPTLLEVLSLSYLEARIRSTDSYE
jgi:hypothetical protein